MHDETMPPGEGVPAMTTPRTTGARRSPLAPDETGSMGTGTGTDPGMWTGEETRMAPPGEGSDVTLPGTPATSGAGVHPDAGVGAGVTGGSPVTSDTGRGTEGATMPGRGSPQGTTMPGGATSQGSTMPGTGGQGMAAGDGALLADDERATLQQRWEAVQASFVDEPRSAVQQADGLVADLMGRITQLFADERSRLEAQWGAGGDAGTEELRVALQRYRSFFQRLLQR